jgi:cytochrome c oxidase subunit III
MSDVMEEHPAPIGRKLLDVSRLQTVAFGNRDPLFWGVVLLIAIEATMFALLATTYFYLRGNERDWPPAGVANAPLQFTIGTALLLALSCAPLLLAFRAAADGRLSAVRRGMLLVTILSAAAAIVRGFEISRIGYRWDSHAYGSVVWALYFMHSLHLASGVIENAVLTTTLYRGPVEKKHMVDVQLGGYYWAFVALSWVPLLLVILLDDGVLQ